MALKIICLEEHIVDADLAQAVGPLAAKEAPYLAGLGSLLEESPPSGSQDRPFLVGPHEAVRLAGAPVDARLRDMDVGAIDMQILSSTQPIQLLPAQQAIALAQRTNDKLAETVTLHKDRFAGFATLPWQDPDAACRELERAITRLGFSGALLAGHPGEATLIDDPAFTLILATLAALEVPLYIHPGPPLPAVQQSYYAGLDPEVTARLSLYGWGWHNEAGIQVIRLILSGAFDRHDSLRVISGHWGEMVPFFLQRMDDAMPPAATGLRRSISETYRDHVYVTPSGMLSLPHFQFIREVVGVDRILFAVDYPYLTLAGARAWLEALPVGDDERVAIAHGTAERLLRLG